MMIYPERSPKRVSSRNRGLWWRRQSRRLTGPRHPKLHSGEIAGLASPVPENIYTFADTAASAETARWRRFRREISQATSSRITM